ncbi:MAG: hypothetical protein H0V47_10940 [Chloroflexia bacterium]|nr:hypothetical protein [Chloroflexia bacterium]
MTQQASRQIALMTLFTCCIVIVSLALASGLNVQMGSVMSQALPLAIVCGAALAILLFEPGDSAR